MRSECDHLAVWTGLVHIPMSLWARTAAQGESLLAHVPMSPLARTAMQEYDLEGSGIVQKCPEVFGGSRCL